jgi:heme A synthase
MAVDTELLSFVKEALANGLPREQIEDALLRAGWRSDQVKNALAAFAENEFPIPVPKPRPYISAREAFMYLILFTTLYISAYNIGKLVFQFINRALPDPAAPANFAEYTTQAIRWSVASLIIALPVFLYVFRLLIHTVKRDPSKRASKVRKWMTYMTLFIAAGVTIGALITLVYNFLAGELTLRFLLKFLTVGFISIALFGYYLWDLRQDDLETKA